MMNVPFPNRVVDAVRRLGGEVHCAARLATETPVGREDRHNHGADRIVIGKDRIETAREVLEPLPVAAAAALGAVSARSDFARP
jgi:hypothetical protein